MLIQIKLNQLNFAINRELNKSIEDDINKQRRQRLIIEKQVSMMAKQSPDKLAEKSSL